MTTKVPSAYVFRPCVKLKSEFKKRKQNQIEDYFVFFSTCSADPPSSQPQQEYNSQPNV